MREETKKKSRIVKLLSLAMDPVAERHWDSIFLDAGLVQTVIDA